MPRNSRRGYTALALLWFIALLAAGAQAQERSKKQDYKFGLREYAGNYQEKSGRTFLISLALGGELGYIDVSTDISDDLAQRSADEFATEDKATAVHFVRDGQGRIAGLRFRQANAAEVYAARVAAEERELTVRSGGAEIRGTLILPPSGIIPPSGLIRPSLIRPSGGKVAAVMIEGGSGWRFGEDMLNYARLAASHGLASFVWDRRGYGDSTGDKAAKFEELADDVAAIAAELRRNPRVDPSRIGFWGFSQAGWIGTLAASRSKNIRFLALFSPALTYPFRQEEENIAHTLQADGEGPAEIQEGLDLFHAKLEYAMFRPGWEKYHRLREELSNKKWFGLLDAPRYASDPEFEFLRRNAHYNSLKALENVHIPVLALFGEFDTNVVPETGMSLLEQGLGLGGRPNLRMYVIPNANHRLMGVHSAKPHDFIVPIRYAPGVWDDMWTWVAEVTGGR